MRIDDNPNPFRLLLRVPVPWVFVLTYLLGAAAEYVWPIHLSAAVVSNAGMAGATLFALGALVAGWGLIPFRKARTTTVPGELSEELVSWGPYRFTRNPMYIGLSLAYLGEAGMMRQVWPVFLLPLTIAYVNWIVIPLEEAKLSEVFGAEYQAYRACVRRWF
jgi:protein-S-isoprenylcysteine O-methyltransferase Ste14